MSSRPTKSSWQGCIVSTVNSYGPPVITACNPRTSPASAIRIISVLPSRDVVESLARPWHRMNIPHGLCPSTSTTACSGKTAACLILLKASIEGRERSQKKPRERRWHFRQLSTQRKPDVLICAPPSPAETRVRPSASNKRKALIIESSWPAKPFYAEGNNGDT